MCPEVFLYPRFSIIFPLSSLSLPIFTIAFPLSSISLIDISISFSLAKRHLSLPTESAVQVLVHDILVLEVRVSSSSPGLRASQTHS